MCICITFHLCFSFFKKNICFISCGFFKLGRIRKKKGLWRKFLLQLPLPFSHAAWTRFLWDVSLLFRAYSWPKIFSFCAILLVIMTLSFRKTCSLTQDLKSMYQFLASLLVLVSVVSLTTQGKKNYDLEFGHFLASVKTELRFLFFFVPFLVVLTWGRGLVEGLLVIHPSISSSSWEES